MLSNHCAVEQTYKQFLKDIYFFFKAFNIISSNEIIVSEFSHKTYTILKV